MTNTKNFKIGDKVEFGINGNIEGSGKDPIGDSSKKSKAGRISLYLQRKGHGCGSELVTLREEVAKDMANIKEVLIPVYHNGKLLNQTTFEEVRKRSTI